MAGLRIVSASLPSNAISSFLLGRKHVCILSQGKKPRDGAMTIGGKSLPARSSTSPKIHLWAAVRLRRPLLNRPRECTRTAWFPGSTVRQPIQSDEFTMVVGYQGNPEMHPCRTRRTLPFYPSSLPQSQSQIGSSKVACTTQGRVRMATEEEQELLVLPFLLAQRPVGSQRGRHIRCSQRGHPEGQG
jgi:hypothetical protein